MPNPSKRKLAQRENLERARSAIPGSVDNVLKQNEEVQKLLSEEKKRVVDLEKRIDVYKTELHRYETCLKNAEEKLSMEIRDHNCTKLALKTCQEKKVASEISYEAQISELQNRCNQLLLESPARGKVLKKYEDISSPHTKNRRCERIVEEMGKFVGEDSLDAFGKDFALFLSKSSRFSFRLSMTVESVLVQIGCDPRAHYQQMNGNQTQALLKPVNIDKVLRVFEPHRDMSLMRRLMNVIGSLMSSSNNSVKSNQEILEMKENLDDLKNVLRLLHPTMSVLPKLHILSAHLIDFVVLNGTWGRTSEQGMESFHALFNQLTKQYASVHNLEHRTFLILRHLMHYNDMTDCSN
ncbi:hypothetical protein CAEBREN_25460 [Caenorhabditis brenneri]|uniref:Uncharacterized protein n=1 Tax=Caenorhabditis brenneri TaxID=135651 RepID=G0N8E1_CAEBE|nr:hypothetical protein CAEBREN_25460 [Caenorhabditis brenneri]